MASQAEFEAESGAEASDDDEPAANGGGGRARDVARALRRCSPLVVYAFKRLCRGLGSSRQGARQGFSLAISALLGASQCIAPGEAVAAIEGVLEPVGKVRERVVWTLRLRPARVCLGMLAPAASSRMPAHSGRAGMQPCAAAAVHPSAPPSAPSFCRAQTCGTRCWAASSATQQ